MYVSNSGGAPPAEKCQGAITRRATDVLGGHKKESVMVAIRPGAKGERAKGGSFRRDGTVRPARAVVPQDLPTAGRSQRR